MDQQKQFDILLTALHTIAENASFTNYETAQEALDKINELEYVFQDKDFPDDPDKVVKMSLSEIYDGFFSSDYYNQLRVTGSRSGEIELLPFEKQFRYYLESNGKPNFETETLTDKVFKYILLTS